MCIRDRNILTLSDYFDKAAEFIPIAVLVALVLVFSLFMYPPRFNNESADEHFKRIGGSEEAYTKLDKRGNFFVSLSLFIVAVNFFFFQPFLYFIMFLPLLGIVLLLPAINILEKHTPPEKRKLLFNEANSLLVIGFWLSGYYVFVGGHSKALKIREKSFYVEKHLVDIIDAGYLQADGYFLVLKDKNMNEITKVAIPVLDRSSLPCKWGLEFVCRSATHASANQIQKSN